MSNESTRTNAEVYQETVARLKNPEILFREGISLTAWLLDFTAEMLQESGEAIYPTQQITGGDGRALVIMRGEDYARMQEASGYKLLAGMNEMAADLRKGE